MAGRRGFSRRSERLPGGGYRRLAMMA